MSHCGPVFHAGEVRDCGFSGIDDGSHVNQSLEMEPKFGQSEIDPTYSGEAMTIHRQTMITAIVGYECGNARYLVISSGFNGGGKKLKIVDDLPEGMGILKPRFETDEETKHLLVVFESLAGDEWGRDDVTELLKEHAAKTDPEWIAELLASRS